MLVELIKGVKQPFRRNRARKMLIDREKMLVLPFRKIRLRAGFEAASQISNLQVRFRERKSLKQ